MKKKASAVVLAAGSSTRMGFDKLAVDLGGETVLGRSLRAFEACPRISEIVVVTGPDDALARQEAARCRKPVHLVAGGATRAESARSGVEAASGVLVAIHDAARPFVSQAVIEAALEGAEQWGAAAPAVPVKDTIKCGTPGDGRKVPAQCLVSLTPDRSSLYAIQTPQCFDRDTYLRITQQLDPEKARLVTDDASLFELSGLPVRLTQGDYANYKITTREDLPGGMQGETNMRIGHGYDVHRLVEGRPLILGGVTVPYEKGLLGHSDADVLTHAMRCWGLRPWGTSASTSPTPTPPTPGPTAWLWPGRWRICWPGPAGRWGTSTPPSSARNPSWPPISPLCAGIWPTPSGFRWRR